MKNHPKETRAKIVDHRRVTADYFRLRILCPEISRVAQPGQFVMLRIQDLHDPFLRRPFSFSRILPAKKKNLRNPFEGGFEICYQVVGRGTERMTHLAEGDRIDVLGPLGRGFWREEGCERMILVGGGIGIAPLIPWAEELTQRKMGKGPGKERTRQVDVLLGGKSQDRILGGREFKKMSLEPSVATEDGSLGLSGMVTDLLERELLSAGPYDGTAIYACGPMVMLAKVAQIAEQFDISCQVLLESRMACGVGACLGCAVKTRAEEGKGNEAITSPPSFPGKNLCDSGEESGNSSQEDLVLRISEPPSFRYARVCKEGPVFRAREILWE
jgi:dihydroorotate dehydrogenase electron transfer subunit